MLAPDTKLQNRYTVVRLLGQGGMGAVYLAKDDRLGSNVALKETFFTNEMLSRAFEREARLLASLRHPALPRVSDHFTEDTGQFLVMEFIPGEDLEGLLRAKNAPFPSFQVMGWADQLLDALDYLHSQQPPVIHRDIKPQNLKLSSRNQIVLLDFGLAKGSMTGMTRAGGNVSIFGYTPHYAPLEQIQGEGTDERSDLYSLAATLYHLVTGRIPVDAITRASAILNKKADPLISPDELNTAVPAGAAAVLMQAMDLNREQRPASADEMRRLLAASKSSAPLGKDEQPTVITPPSGAILNKIQPTQSQDKIETAAPRATEALASMGETRSQPARASVKRREAQASVIHSKEGSNRTRLVFTGVIGLTVFAAALFFILNSNKLFPDPNPANSNQSGQSVDAPATSAEPAVTNVNVNSNTPDNVSEQQKKELKTSDEASARANKESANSNVANRRVIRPKRLHRNETEPRSIVDKAIDSVKKMKKVKPIDRRANSNN